MFLRGQKILLKNIRRRKANHQSHAMQQQGVVEPCVEVGPFGLDGEVDRLRRDRQVLMVELVKLNSSFSRKFSQRNFSRKFSQESFSRKLPSL